METTYAYFSGTITLCLPFTGSHSMGIRNRLTRLMRSAYPTVNLRVIYRLTNRIGAAFSPKDRVPTSLRSQIVYRFTCRSCAASYVGRTVRHFCVRIREHSGLTLRRGRPSKKEPTNSAVWQHSKTTGHPLDSEQFSVMDSAISTYDLAIKEALHIYYSKPVLNVQSEFDSLVLF